MSGQREQAKRHLLGLVEFGSGGDPPLREAGIRHEIDGRRRARMEAAAEVLVELGLLTEADTAPYRVRLEHAIAERDSERPIGVDERLAARARALLERRLAAVRDGPELARMPAELERPPPPDPSHRGAIDRFEQLYFACEKCRALPEAELSKWRERLREADDGRDFNLERERRQMRFTQTELGAVVRGPAARQGPFRITTAELYADGVLLRWHEAGASLARTAPAERARRLDPARRQVSLSDDLGTSYLHFHTSEAHSHAAVLWTASFATPVPAAARELRIAIRDERFVLPLREERALP